VTVLEEDCDEDDGGGLVVEVEKLALLGARATGGGLGDCSGEASGLAIRSPPSVCERERSPFMLPDQERSVQ
jgi:hypothetical protein